MRWLKNGSGRWHLWRNGDRSACGLMKREHLPALDIRVEVNGAEFDKRCRGCLRVVENTVVPRAASSWEEQWRLLLHMQIKKRRVGVLEPDLAELARRLAELGPPSAEINGTFEWIASVLLKPVRSVARYANGRTRSSSRTPGLKAALAAVPPEVGSLNRLGLALETWATITRRDIRTEKIRPENVVKGVYVAPDDLEGYVKFQQRRGRSALAQVFHPNSVEWAKKDPLARGLFRGAAAYWDSVKGSVRVVE